MKISNKQLDLLLRQMILEQADSCLSENQLKKLIKRTFKEQFEWTDEELASMGNEEDDTEAEEWFSDFTNEMTGLEDEHDYPWDDEYVGKSDRAERFVEEGKKSRCWDGYKPVRGKAPYSKGSCEKVSEANKKKPKSPSQKVRKPTAPPSRQHKDPTKYDRKRDKKVPLDEMRPGGRSYLQGQGEDIAPMLVAKVLADLRRILGYRKSWVDPRSWEELEAALLQVARQAYSELDEID